MSGGWQVGDSGVWSPADLFGAADSGVRHPLDAFGVARDGVRDPIVSSVSSGTPPDPAQLVTRSGTGLLLGGAPWRFVGFNAYGIQGCESGTAWTRSQLDTYFAALKPNSMTRLWAFEQYGPATLDQVVASAEANSQKVCLVLNNSINACVADGGKTISWFQTGYAAGSYLNWCTYLANRYRSSPAIGMWECINEAGANLGTHQLDGTYMLDFFQTVASTIKAADPYHLVGTGDTGEFSYITNADYQEASSAAAIDVLSLHDYESDFTPGSPSISTHFSPCLTIANTLGKPLIVGELNDSACGITKAARSATVMTSVDDYFTAGADGVMIWNFGQNYYNTCPAPGNDYIVVTTDPLAAAIRSYTIA